MCVKVLKKIKDNLDEAKTIFDDEYSLMAEETGEDMLYDHRYVQEDEMDQWENECTELYEEYAHCQGHCASYSGAQAVLDAYQDNDDCDCGEDILEEILILLNKEIM